MLRGEATVLTVYHVPAHACRTKVAREREREREREGGREEGREREREREKKGKDPTTASQHNDRNPLQLDIPAKVKP